jgi:type IV secretion system protein VirB1
MLPDLEQWVAQCAPQISVVTMMAIVRVESGGNPYALNINGPKQLAHQPQSSVEAISKASWLIAHGQSVDMGLAQVNSSNLNRLGVTVEQMFDPCANLAAGARILTSYYGSAASRYGQGQFALQAAISAYNTGNHQKGLRNGYVAKVISVAYSPLNTRMRDVQPLLVGTPHQPQSYWERRPIHSINYSGMVNKLPN